MTKKDSLTGFYKENEELWLWDSTPELGMELGFQVESLLHFEQSPYQEISVIDTKGFGRMLVLDGVPQYTTKDGYMYNEMLAHVPLATHPDPQRIAMIGGGDCGPAREAMKYGSLRHIDVVEIDSQVIDVCQKWLTHESFLQRDSRVRVIIRDGYSWIKELSEPYDVLLIDRPDPFGPAAALYSDEFYAHVHKGLSSDGMAVFQSGSPFYNPQLLQDTVSQAKKLFPIVRVYLLTVPCFPGGIWSLTLASKKWDPLEADTRRLQWQDAKYINPDIFRTSFTLPTYVKQLLSDHL
ncbi:polyamine aminopropyltransferase [Brevibacillus sp. SYP-B805]|uniref:polyamine aminopropyltransferase n=1 Tax=Brevibacillus sp. SYP-B805 TaxID=1578199 RepID=UPI0013EAEF30|nr:polyamine aminopropyltransferase [Brevibacillus sp. SYP-B805]NGQ96162.1 polyamine aminopropyltransferase [Brevibacillus sp. SYP-B805]